MDLEDDSLEIYPSPINTQTLSPIQRRSFRSNTVCKLIGSMLVALLALVLFRSLNFQSEGLKFRDGLYMDYGIEVQFIAGNGTSLLSSCNFTGLDNKKHLTNKIHHYDISVPLEIRCSQIEPFEEGTRVKIEMMGYEESAIYLRPNTTYFGSVTCFFHSKTSGISLAWVRTTDLVDAVFQQTDASNSQEFVYNLEKARSFIKTRYNDPFVYVARVILALIVVMTVISSVYMYLLDTKIKRKWCKSFAVILFILVIPGILLIVL